MRMPVANMVAACQQSVALDPEYFASYFEVTFSMLPRWYGKAGDAERFAAQQADATRATLGDTVYARIGTYLLTREPELCTREKFSWARIKKGLDDINKRHVNSCDDIMMAAEAGVNAGDKDYARKQLLRLEGASNLNSQDLRQISKWRSWAGLPATPP